MSRTQPARLITKLSAVLLAGIATNACAAPDPQSAAGLQSASSVKPASKTAYDTLFVPITDAIPFENSRRRKWDSPVIADVDQNGLQDIIITEHGRSVLIFWNEGQGKFSKAQRLAGGDLHGIAVSDYDRDGVMDVVIQQGGGGGANPRRPLHLRIDKDRTIVSRDTFDYFEKGRGRAAKFTDFDGNGLLDLVVTGFPTKDQTEGANHLYTNVTEEQFVFSGNLPQAQWLGYRLVPSDLDGDGTNEMVFFGGKNMVAAQHNEDRSFANINASAFGPLAKTSDIATAVEIDFDNDGDFDLFLPRAEHQFDLEHYYDAQAQTYAFITFRKPFLHDNLKVEGDLVLENLQRTYPHYDIFLGKDRVKLPEVPDRHAGRDLTIAREDAMGWPEGKTEAGLYIGYMGDGMWRIGGQTRSRLAAVVRNVAAAEPGEPQQLLPAKLLENRGGRFVDVTAAMGIDIAEQTTGAATGDFNNDGYADLAVLKYGNMAQVNTHMLLLNQGGNSFEQVDGHGIKASGRGMTGGAIEAFDYNSDGALDLVQSDERGRWQLFENQIANRGNFAIVRVGNSPSGRALNAEAVLTVAACGQTYRKWVGSGSAAFSQSMNSELHIGLGTCTKVDSASVRWSNGETANVTLKVNAITPVGS